MKAHGSSSSIHEIGNARACLATTLIAEQLNVPIAVIAGIATIASIATIDILLSDRSLPSMDTLRQHKSPNAKTRHNTPCTAASLLSSLTTESL
jgi:hypothetical protein